MRQTLLRGKLLLPAIVKWTFYQLPHSTIIKSIIIHLFANSNSILDHSVQIAIADSQRFEDVYSFQSLSLDYP